MKELRFIVFILVLIHPHHLFSQKKDIPLIWTFHDKNVNVHGLSVGAWSFSDEPRNTRTNGIRLEVPGVGLLLMMAPQSPIPESEEEFNSAMEETPSERTNGIALSVTGTVCRTCVVNGLTAGAVGEYIKLVNGISASTFGFIVKQNGIQADIYFALSYQTNGVQMAVVMSEAKRMRGIQIGGITKATDLRGIQIGFWNINQRRKFPIINWCFRKSKNEAVSDGPKA